jgi:arsenate reductase
MSEAATATQTTPVTPELTLYGIANCDTVKKARAWLSAHAQAYTFHDFKKAGLPAPLVAQWLQALDWQTLVNRKGTTWRALDPAHQASIVDASSAAELMLAYPSVVKRPVLRAGANLLVGYDPARYQSLLLPPAA